jgi:peptide/nickel transport system ATP-binding protein
VYQSPDAAMNPRQTVEQIIGRPLSFYHGARGAARRTRVIELLRLVEMGEHFLSRRPSDLSGGQKQRVCIARALAAEPELLICDEITAALDPLVAEEVLKMMLRLQKQTVLSFVFITHDISIVRAIADSVAVMHNGSIVRYGQKIDVLSPPYDAYTEVLLESVPEMRVGWLDEKLAGRDHILSKISGGTNAVTVGMSPS